MKGQTIVDCRETEENVSKTSMRDVMTWLDSLGGGGSGVKLENF